VIFLIVEGRWPDPEVDHADFDGMNNRWDNLREATSTQNKTNRRVRKDSCTGVKGVWIRPSGRAAARITLHGNTRCLGTRDTIEEAAELYRNAANDEHGQFARIA
jgi:hypothetical protein